MNNIICSLRKDLEVLRFEYDAAHSEHIMALQAQDEENREVQEDLQRLYTDLDRSIGDRVSLATRNVSSDHTAQQQELGELRVRHQASDGC